MSTILTASVIAKESLMLLENELGVLDTFYRAHEDEYKTQVNGYKKGATVSIRRPADYVVRSGAVMNVQESIEGKVDLTVNQQKGVDFEFSSTDLTLSISELNKRFLKPAISNLVNEVAYDCLATFLPKVYNYVGTPNTAVDSYDDFAIATERMNHMAIPMDSRYAIVNPRDQRGLKTDLVGKYMSSDARGAYRKGVLGDIDGVDILMSQIMPAQDYGTADNTTPLTDGNSQEVTYDSVKNTWKQTLLSDGWATTKTLKAGQMFTIAGVYMVNPKTKRSTGILQNFVIMEDITTNASGAANTDPVISPPIIVSGPHQTVTYSGNFDGLAITLIGPASGTAQTYRQNVAFHKNAFALAVVPMEMPEGSVNGARETYKGLSVRVIPVYDGVNDISKWRLDILYGREAIDQRLAVRFSGT